MTAQVLLDSRKIETCKADRLVLIEWKTTREKRKRKKMMKMCIMMSTINEFQLKKCVGIRKWQREERSRWRMMKEKTKKVTLSNCSSNSSINSSSSSSREARSKMKISSRMKRSTLSTSFSSTSKSSKHWAKATQRTI